MLNSTGLLKRLSWLKRPAPRCSTICEIKKPIYIFFELIFSVLALFLGLVGCIDPPKETSLVKLFSIHFFLKKRIAIKSLTWLLNQYWDLSFESALHWGLFRWFLDSFHAKHYFVLYISSQVMTIWPLSSPTRRFNFPVLTRKVNCVCGDINCRVSIARSL